MSYFTHICKELRLEAGLTQQELAPKIGISSSAIGMLEKGYREPTGSTLLAYANYFDVSIDSLMGREDDTASHQNLPEKKEAPIAERSRLSELQKNYINEFKALFSEETFWKYTKIYRAMDRDTRIFILGYICSYLQSVGMNVDVYLKK